MSCGGGALGGAAGGGRRELAAARALLEGPHLPLCALHLPSDAVCQRSPHHLSPQLDEIDKSIDAAEKNPQRFKLSQQEISDRRKWVMSTRRQVRAAECDTPTAQPAAAVLVRGRCNSPHGYPRLRRCVSPRSAHALSAAVQIETVRGTLEAGTSAAAPSTAASKLAAAAREENDNFIRTQGDHQQLLMQ